MRICMLNERFSNGGLSNVTRFIGQSISKEHEMYFYSFIKKNKSTEMNKDFFSTQSRFSGETLLEKCYRKSVYFYFEHLNKKRINTLLLYNNRIKEFLAFVRNKNIDLVILNGGLLTSLIPYFKKELPNLKIIAWQHNNATIYMNNYYKDILNSYLIGLKKADAVVTLTEYDRSVLSEYNSNTYAIYNPIDKQGVNNGWKSELNNKNISFTSRYSIRQKGIDLLIDLAKKIPDDWTITFAGSGSRMNIYKVKRKLKKEKINNIRLVGHLKNEELNSHYLNSSIFVSTSRWEGFGLVLLEAMSFGLPIVSFQTSGPIEILQQGEYGILIEKYDTNIMAEEIINLINDEKKRKLYQEASLKRVKDFDIANILPQWLNVINKL